MFFSFDKRKGFFIINLKGSQHSHTFELQIYSIIRKHLKSFKFHGLGYCKSFLVFDSCSYSVFKLLAIRTRIDLFQTNAVTMRFVASHIFVVVALIAWFLVLFFLFWNRVSCVSCCSETFYIAEDGLYVCSCFLPSWVQVSICDTVPGLCTRDQTHSFVTVNQLNNISSTIFIRNKVIAHKGNKGCMGKG